MRRVILALLAPAAIATAVTASASAAVISPKSPIMKIGTAATNVAYAVRRTTTVRGPRGGVYVRGGGYYGGRYYGGGVYARRGVYARGGYYGRGVYASRGVYARGPRGGVYASRGVYARGPRGGVYVLPWPQILARILEGLGPPSNVQAPDFYEWPPHRRPYQFRS